MEVPPEGQARCDISKNSISCKKCKVVNNSPEWYTKANVINTALCVSTFSFELVQDDLPLNGAEWDERGVQERGSGARCTNRIRESDENETNVMPERATRRRGLLFAANCALLALRSLAGQAGRHLRPQSEAKYPRDGATCVAKERGARCESHI